MCVLTHHTHVVFYAAKASPQLLKSRATQYDDVIHIGVFWSAISIGNIPSTSELVKVWNFFGLWFKKNETMLTVNMRQDANWDFKCQGCLLGWPLLERFCCTTRTVTRDACQENINISCCVFVQNCSHIICSLQLRSSPSLHLLSLPSVSEWHPCVACLCMEGLLHHCLLLFIMFPGHQFNVIVFCLWFYFSIFKQLRIITEVTSRQITVWGLRPYITEQYKLLHWKPNYPTWASTRRQWRGKLINPSPILEGHCLARFPTVSALTASD